MFERYGDDDYYHRGHEHHIYVENDCYNKMTGVEHLRDDDDLWSCLILIRIFQKSYTCNTNEITYYLNYIAHGICLFNFYDGSLEDKQEKSKQEAGPRRGGEGGGRG